MASISKTVGYLRVSTVDQDLDKNKAEILRLVHDHDPGCATSPAVEGGACRAPWVNANRGLHIEMRLTPKSEDQVGGIFNSKFRDFIVRQ